MKDNRNIFWKIYFWPVSIFIVVGIIGIAIVEDLNWLSSADLLIGLTAIVGMYGYVYQKKFLSGKFWKQYFIFFIAWELLYGIIYDLIVECQYIVDTLMCQYIVHSDI